MSEHFEVTWKMYGRATVEADSLDEAIKFASYELINWTGMGLDFSDLTTDGADVDS